MPWCQGHLPGELFPRLLETLREFVSSSSPPLLMASVPEPGAEMFCALLCAPGSTGELCFNFFFFNCLGNNRRGRKYWQVGLEKNPSNPRICLFRWIWG